jgi:hypothetical protein
LRSRVLATRSHTQDISDKNGFDYNSIMQIEKDEAIRDISG